MTKLIEDWVIRQAEESYEPEEERIVRKWVRNGVQIGLPASVVAGVLPRLLLAKRAARSSGALLMLCALTGSAAGLVSLMYSVSKLADELTHSDTAVGAEMRSSQDERARCRYLMSGGDPAYYKPMEFQITKRVVAADENAVQSCTNAPISTQK